MVDKSQKYDEKLFKGLSLPGKEFILPNISSPWLLEEFVVHRNLSDGEELKSYPTAILDDSCLYEALTKPSIPLVESVEAFFLGYIDNPFGYPSAKPNIDDSGSELKGVEDHGLQSSGVDDAENGIHPGPGTCQNVQGDVSASRANLQITSNNPEAS